MPSAGAVHWKGQLFDPVVPGDQIIFEVELVAKRSSFAKIKGRALVDDEVVCEAQMMSALADR